MKLTLHARIELALAGALLLGSCTPDIEDRIDVADVNARNALLRISELESRIEEIEGKLNL